MRGFRTIFFTGLTTLLFYSTAVAQEDIKSKVENIYQNVVLKGTKGATIQGEVFEVDNKNYNINAKKDGFITICQKDKNERIGFLDMGIDGIPDVYIKISVYPGPANATSITNEAIELFKSRSHDNTTINGKYTVINSPDTDMQEKYNTLVDKVNSEGL